MRRKKHVKVKHERPETSFTSSQAKEEYDLAYFVHDRVELMRQAFSVLKPKEIKAMAPECVRKLSNDDLEELCLEELLGISSKRLCAVLDGAEPPSETDSSSDSELSSSADRERSRSMSDKQVVEVIDLDSLSDVSLKSDKNKKSKNKKKKHKEKHNKKKPPEQTPSSSSELQPSTSAAATQPVTSTTVDTQSRASRAGMTVLELLELQARARAIRAQLNAAAAKDAPTLSDAKATSEDEVEIKEETTEVVEISSDEEKPEIEELKRKIEELDKRIAEKTVEKEPEPPPPATKQKKHKKQKDKANSPKPKTKSSPAKCDDNVTATSVAPPADVGLTELPKELPKSKTRKKNKETKETVKNKENKEMNKSKDENNADIVIDLDESSSESVSSKAAEGTVKINKSPDKQTAKGDQNENDYTVVIPRNIPTTARRIKLNRNNVVISVANVPDKEIRLASAIEANRVSSAVKQVKKINSAVSKVSRKEVTNVPKVYSVIVPAQRESEPSVDDAKSNDKKSRTDDKSKKKKKDKKRKDSSDKELSDNYEITLQLSDSEKMDLLEDLDQKNLENVSSSSSDSDSSSESDDSQNSLNTTMETDNLEKVHQSSNAGKDIIEKENINKSTVKYAVEVETPDTNFSEDNLETKECKENDNCAGNGLVTNNDDNVIGAAKCTSSTTEESQACPQTVAENMEIKENNDNAKDQQKNGCHVKSLPISTNAIKEMEVDTTTLEHGMETPTKESRISPENLIMAIDQVNKDNINVSTDKTIVVSCIDDIPIVQEEFGPKPYEEVVIEKASEKPANENSEMDASTDALTKGSESERDKENCYSKEKDKEHNQTFDENTEQQLDLGEKNRKTDNSVVDPTRIEAETSEETKTVGKAPSEEGEISEVSSSEVEAFDLKPDVVCISDGDDEAQSSTTNGKHKKNKKKKDKKIKKDKKCKKHRKENFRDVADHNFFDPEQNRKSPAAIKDPESSLVIDEPELNDEADIKIISNPTHNSVIIDSDDVYEILELSDDSSCYEVEGVSVLSKEPTSEEIEALSAKIDKIERVDVVTDEEIRDYENRQAVNEEKEKDLENLETISWKDRYLDSTKVKKVLTTSNIFNAMRKKNKELKRKMQESKVKELEEQQKRKEEERNKKEAEEEINVEEGSIEHFNMLQTSNKYVDPVPESKPLETTQERNTEGNELDTENTVSSEKEPILLPTENENLQTTPSKELKKDAKQLLKMYKRLLKYNDINKQNEKNPNKKKKKKQKKKKDEIVRSVASSEPT